MYYVYVHVCGCVCVHVCMGVMCMCDTVWRVGSMPTGVRTTSMATPLPSRAMSRYTCLPTSSEAFIAGMVAIQGTVPGSI